ncbi:MAG: hypothetical protein HY520_01470 [Candidatus Aenigmarchaeota archaeon]|nr:hypothetical protein [Candidatus Aenigmarchaeota archaeon]
MRLLTAFLLIALAAPLDAVQQKNQGKSFADLVGPVKVGEVADARTLQMGFILWGGDVATHYANGGLRTTPSSFWGQAGLSINLVPGDDFVQQTRDYLAGKTPFLRGTFGMCAMASEVINRDPRTKGVVILQETWSTGGDNLVVRGGINTLQDVRGKTLILQEGGPHLNLLWDMLASAGLTVDDVIIRWAKNITGPESPGEIFRTDSSVHGAFVVTPDLLALCGGYDTAGSGAEGTVKGARRLAGTKEFSRSIADVILVRKDFYDRQQQTVQKIVNGLFRATEQFVTLSKKADGTDPEFVRILEQSRQIWGTEVFPTLDDIRGLATEDCSFVGYPGNVVFFTEKGNLTGFEAHQKASLDMVLAMGICRIRTGFFPSGFDYGSAVLAAGLTKTGTIREAGFRAEAVEREIEALTSGEMDEHTILPPFAVAFEPNEEQFLEDVYGNEFQMVVDKAAMLKGAVFIIRGHADPAKVLKAVTDAGLAKGILTRSGRPGSYSYYLNGQPLNLSQTGRIQQLISEGAFEPGAGDTFDSPQEIVRAALNLSKQRADTFVDTIISYAALHGLQLDRSQFTSQGVGIAQPLISIPRSMAEAKQNMRVEFRAVKVSAEAVSEKDFDF